MMRPLESVQVHLCRDPVDFRKAINGLSILVAEELDPFSAHVFGLCNRRRDQVKLLYWERNGFVLWQKRRNRSPGSLLCGAPGCPGRRSSILNPGGTSAGRPESPLEPAERDHVNREGA